MYTARNQIDAQDGHGTLVAGVLGARKDNSRLHGVAFNSSLLVLRSDTPDSCAADDGCKFSTTVLAQAIDYAVANGAQVINMSLGGDNSLTPTLRAAMDRATAAGIVIVAAAGNADTDETPAPNPTSPGSYAAETSSRGLAIAVGAVEADNSIAAFSNRAGTAQNFFLVAPGGSQPGGGILTTGIDDPATPVSEAYVLAAGTSVATPSVAGSVALLLQGFPSLTPQQAVDILLVTATDLGDPGVDPIYGRGLVNLQRAFQPVGTATVSFGPAGDAATSPASTDAAPLALTMAPASGAFGDWAEHSAVFEGLMFRDSFDRPFTADIAPPRPSSMALERFETLAEGNRRRGGWVATPRGAAFLRWDDEPQVRSNFGTDPNGTDYEWGATMRFGDAELGFANESAAPGAVTAPVGLLSLADQIGAAASLAQSDRWAHAAYDVGAWRLSARASLDSQALSAMSVARHFGDHLVAFETGAVREEESAMGGLLAARLGGDDRARSQFSALEWSGPVGFGWRGRARGEILRTDLRDAYGLDIIDKPWASAWTLGVERALAPDLTLGFALSQSLRAEAGRVALNVPVAGLADGDTVYELREAALTPSGREIGLESVVQWRAADNVFIRAATRYADDPGHVAGAGGEIAGWADIAVEF
jgi:hypothetical protein